MTPLGFGRVARAAARGFALAATAVAAGVGRPAGSRAQDSSPVAAAPSPPTGRAAVSPSSGSAVGVVKIDGAMVFPEPNMESDPIATLPKGKRVAISRARYGPLQMPFLKVRLEGGRIGYVASLDVDDGVRPAAKPQPDPPVERARTKRAKKARQDEGEDERPSLFEARYLGPIAAQLDYADGIAGAELREWTWFLGAKLTSPGLLVRSPSEINLLFHLGAPSFYEPYSTTKPTGYALFVDALVNLPFVMSETALVYFGAGPLAHWSDWTVSSGGETRRLSQLGLGLSLALSGAVRVGKFTVRLEYKHMIESRTHRGLALSLQREF